MSSQVWHPFTQMKTAPAPVRIVRAEGTLLFDDQGKSYIDANSSWWVNVHGHGRPEIGKAISEQFQQLDHVIFAGAIHPQAENLAKNVVELLACDLQKVFFSDDGSTAVEVALKMAAQFWFNQGISKKRIVALDGAYHGDTFGAMSLGERGLFFEAFEHYFFDVDFIDFPEAERESELLEKAEHLFETEEVAALIVEPLVQGSAGMRMYSTTFLNNLVLLAKKYQVIVIFDEVMTAWGRTGEMFAFNHLNVQPDIICLSKGLTGGVLPLGLTVATDFIYEAFLHDEKSKALLHGHSFTGNPLSCAAANASIEIFKSAKSQQARKSLAQMHQDFLQDLQSTQGIKNAQVLGCILRFEIAVNEESGYFSSIRDKAYNYFLAQGCWIRPLGNVIYLNPPYCITEEEYAQLRKVILAFVGSL